MSMLASCRIWPEEKERDEVMKIDSTAVMRVIACTEFADQRDHHLYSRQRAFARLEERAGRDATFGAQQSWDIGLRISQLCDLRPMAFFGAAPAVSAFGAAPAVPPLPASDFADALTVSITASSGTVSSFGAGRLGAAGPRWTSTSALGAPFGHIPLARYCRHYLELTLLPGQVFGELQIYGDHDMSNYAPRTLQLFTEDRGGARSELLRTVELPQGASGWTTLLTAASDLPAGAAQGVAKLRIEVHSIHDAGTNTRIRALRVLAGAAEEQSEGADDTAEDAALDKGRGPFDATTRLPTLGVAGAAALLAGNTVCWGGRLG